MQRGIAGTVVILCLCFSNNFAFNEIKALNNKISSIMTIFTKEKLVRIIVIEARKHKVPPLVMIAQAYTESSFRPWVINKNEKGGRWSRGLFQIQARTGWSNCKLTKEQLMIAKWNIRCAAIIHQNNLIEFTKKKEKFSIVKMLFAYNAGGYYKCTTRHHIKKIKCDIGYPVNYDYLTKTIKHYVDLQPKFEKWGVKPFKSVDFLGLAQKYIDSIPETG